MPRDGSSIYHVPPGTQGIPDTTVASTPYNAFLADIEQDANLPRPVIAGGTGATNAPDAMTNLGGELSAQVIANYNADPFQAGSFYSAAGATGAPTANAFTGICYAAVISGSVTTDLFIEARDQVTTNLWVRQKKANVWQPWSQAAGVASGPTVPVGVTPNTLWWDPTRGKLFIYYQDVDSSQWVEAVAVPDVDPNTFVEISGDTMNGPLILSGDPTLPLGAGTKQYIDAGDAASVASAAKAVGARGQCRLVKSGANLVLLPFGGNLLTVNGVNCTVPDAGVSLAPTGLTPATYLIYAVATAGVVTALEASTTAHATSTTAGNKGVEIKSGDDTRSVVGIAAVLTGPVFTDTPTQRLVRSWFNRGTTVMQGASDTVSITTISASFTEAATSRISGVNFAGEIFNGSAFGAITNTTSAAAVGIVFFVDGAAAGVVQQEANPAAVSYRCPICLPYMAVMTEGLHNYDYGCRATGGGTFNATYGMTTAGTITQ